MRGNLICIFVVVLAVLGGAQVAHGGRPSQYVYRVLFDTDNIDTTGCDVAVDDRYIATTLHGIDQIVTVPSKLPPPGRQAPSADSVQLTPVPVPTTHARAREGGVRHGRSRASPKPLQRNALFLIVA